MTGSPQAAKERYMLDILPAGRNDRVAEILDRSGNVLKLIYCPHRLADAVDEEADRVVRRDWENMDAEAFARKYEIPGG
jgi:hypothetical protein